MTPLSSGADQAGAGPEGKPSDGADGDRPTDSTLQQLVEVLKAELGDAVVGSEVAGDDVWVRVDPGAWLEAAEACKRRLDIDYFCSLSGIDWMDNPDLSGEKRWDPDGTAADGEAGTGEAAAEEGDAPGAAYATGRAGGDTRFQVLARLYSTTRHLGVTLKADLDQSDARVASWVSVYRGADWHERETWEMYGFTFDGHPGLRHLYLPGEFEGYPLRKDFPLLSREVKPWPGLVDVEAMPGESEGQPEAGEG